LLIFYNIFLHYESLTIAGLITYEGIDSKSCFQVREEEGGDSLTLTGLQTLLTEEYGEAHFNAAGQ
jgi:hypothetical protein